MKHDRRKACFFLLFVSAMVMAFATLPSETRAREIVRGIVILAEFPDVKHDVRTDAVQVRFSDHLNRYVRAMSYDKVSLQLDFTKRWHRVPDSIERYRISPRNLEVDRSRVRKLIDDVLDAVDKEVDFSKYAFSVIVMGAKLADYGMIGLCGYPGMLGWGTNTALRTGSGQAIRGGVAIFSYQAHLGTLFHDVAHILGGVRGGKRMVPCLYDHDLQARPGPVRDTAVGAMINMGFWDPMSCHFYKRELPPPGLSSWTKLRLNWIDPSRIKIIQPGQKVAFTLGPLEEGSSEVLVARLPVTETEYYLIENRQPLGFDKNLPGSGVLIMYADDSVPECRHGNAPVKLVNAAPAVPRLEGAAFDVGLRDSFQDEKNGISIRIEEKMGRSYRVSVTR